MSEGRGLNHGVFFCTTVDVISAVLEPLILKPSRLSRTDQTNMLQSGVKEVDF